MSRSPPPVRTTRRACGPGLGYLVDVMPLTEVLATILRGDASCATVEGAFLGVSLPAWTLLCFLGLSLWTLAGVFGLGTRRGHHD